MLQQIKSAYALFEQMHLSVTGLVVISLILCLAFLFTVREAASWFFKVDDLKRDLSALRDITGQLEGEIRNLQALLGHAKQTSLNIVPPTTEAPIAPQPPPQAAKSQSAAFTFTH